MRHSPRQRVHQHVWRGGDAGVLPRWDIRTPGWFIFRDLQTSPDVFSLLRVGFARLDLSGRSSICILTISAVLPRCQSRHDAAACYCLSPRATLGSIASR
jgi:hypothetical protein